VRIHRGIEIEVWISGHRADVNATSINRFHNFRIKVEVRVDSRIQIEVGVVHWERNRPRTVVLHGHRAAAGGIQVEVRVGSRLFTAVLRKRGKIRSGI
jgi:hypothetical protein